jgi:hypothetical protein
MPLAVPRDPGRPGRPGAAELGLLVPPLSTPTHETPARPQAFASQTASPTNTARCGLVPAF